MDRHLKCFFLASGMTEKKAHKEATVYADDQIAAIGTKLVRREHNPQLIY
jgi:hypothetical protein